MSDIGNSAASRDIAYLMHPYTNQEKHKETGPMIAVKGEGIWIEDDSGKRYLEGLSGLWCTSLGYNEQRLIDAATRQMKELPFSHLFASKSTNPAIDLAEKLLSIAPPGFTRDDAKVFFANSGSEANDTVVKLVWYYNNALGRPEKKKIIARQRGYHGVTVASASMTGLPANHTDFDLPIANILHTDCPHYYRFGEDGESEEDFATRMADNLEKQILEEGPETVAAFIAEPVMGAGGVLVPPKGYFQKIQAVLRKYDILMVADEVICGFGRLGPMFGSEVFGIEPDIMTVAKALSSAYLPISALLVGGKVANVVSQNSGKIGTFGHGYTYSGHPVSAAVALETLNIYEDRDILSHIAEISPVMQKGLRALEDHPLVGEVRGLGLIGAVELNADKSTKESFDPKLGVAAYLVGRAQEHGLILRPLMGDAIAFCPPLIITAEEVEIMLERFKMALNDTTEWLKGQ